MFKNLRSIITLVSLVAALSLFGVGYAAWTFSDDAAATTETNTAITAATNEGNLEVDLDSVYLVIDQNFVGFASTNNASSSDIEKIKLTYNGSSESVDETVSFEVEVTNNLSDYLVLTGGSFDIESVNYVGDEIVVYYTLPTISWVEGMCPTNKESYDAMCEAIGTATITFSFNATID